MNRIRVKFEIIMILTIVMIGSTSSTSSTTQQPPTTVRLRHERSTHLEREYNRNAVQVNMHWKCGTPRERVVYLHEALNGEPVLRPDMNWILKATVLHRCENALGCCNNDKTCSPSEEEDVTITFKAVNPHTEQVLYQEVVFRNHTRCSCI